MAHNTTGGTDGLASERWSLATCVVYVNAVGSYSSAPVHVDSLGVPKAGFEVLRSLA